MKERIKECLLRMLEKKKRNVIKLRWEKERLKQQIQQAKDQKEIRGEE